MKETAEQYIGRILGYLGEQQPLATQAKTPDRLARLVKGVPKGKLAKRPAPDKWSVAEILAHMADTEIAGGWRIRYILGSNGAPVQGFDQDTWIGALHSSRRDPHESVETFRALRRANLALLKSLAPEQWENHGIHSERGKETVLHITKLFAGHDLNHVRQIEAILGASGKTKKTKKKSARR
jgi:hypothetical protein